MMIRDKDKEYFIEYWSEGWGSKTSAWPMAHEHKKITRYLGYVVEKLNVYLSDTPI